MADILGKEVRLNGRDIEEQNVLPLSPMPANVGETLSERDCLDLIAYLMKQEQPPATKQAR